MPKILVVDDDSHIREVVSFALSKAGYEVCEAADGAQAIKQVDTQSLDLIVLDIVMPEMDGLEVCRKIRANSTTPIIFLSSRDEELDRILGLEMGADDYLTKPFSPRELVARVKAVLRRSQGSPAESVAGSDGAEEILEHGPLRLDQGRHHCSWSGTEVILTVTEFGLLQAMIRYPGRVYSRAELVERAYGHGHVITERTVDSHIRRIRKKLSETGGDPIETVYGVGYRVREAVS